MSTYSLKERALLGVIFVLLGILAVGLTGGFIAMRAAQS